MCHGFIISCVSYLSGWNDCVCGLKCWNICVEMLKYVCWNVAMMCIYVEILKYMCWNAEILCTYAEMLKYMWNVNWARWPRWVFVLVGITRTRAGMGMGTIWNPGVRVRVDVHAKNIETGAGTSLGETKKSFKFRHAVKNSEGSELRNSFTWHSICELSFSRRSGKKLRGWRYNGVAGYGDFMIEVWCVQNKSIEELNFHESFDYRGEKEGTTIAGGFMWS